MTHNQYQRPTSNPYSVSDDYRHRVSMLLKQEFQLEYPEARSLIEYAASQEDIENGYPPTDSPEYWMVAYAKAATKLEKLAELERQQKEWDASR